MKYFIFFLALFILQIFQAGFLDQLGLGQVGNLMLLFVAVSIILESPSSSLFLALALGLMLDLMSGTIDGTLLLSLCLVWSVLVVLVSRIVTGEPNRLVLFSGATAATLVFAIGTVAINKIFNYFGLDTLLLDWKYLLGRKLLADLAVNLILSFPVYLYFLKVKQIMARFKLT